MNCNVQYIITLPNPKQAAPKADRNTEEPYR